MKALEIYTSFFLVSAYLVLALIVLTQRKDKRNQNLLTLAIFGLTIGTVFRTFTLLILDEIAVILLFTLSLPTLRFKFPVISRIPIFFVLLNIILSAIFLDLRIARFILVLASIMFAIALGYCYATKYEKLLNGLWWASLIAISLYSLVGFIATIVLGNPLALFLISGSGTDSSGESYISIIQGSAYVSIVYVSLLSSNLLLRIHKDRLDWKTPASVLAVALVSLQYDSRSGYLITLLFLVSQLFLLGLSGKIKFKASFRFVFVALVPFLAILAIMNIESIVYFVETQLLQTFLQGLDSRDANRLIHFLAYQKYVISEPFSSLVGAGIYSHKSILADYITPGMLSQLDRSHYLPGMGIDLFPEIVRTNFIIAALIDLGIIPLVIIFSVAISAIFRSLKYTICAKTSYYIFLIPSLTLISLSSNISDAVLAFVLIMLPLVENHSLPSQQVS